MIESDSYLYFVVIFCLPYDFESMPCEANLMQVYYENRCVYLICTCLYSQHDLCILYATNFFL